MGGGSLSSKLKMEMVFCECVLFEGCLLEAAWHALLLFLAQGNEFLSALFHLT